MTEYSFTFLVDGVDPHEEGFEDRFFEAGCDDATLALMHGMIAVCFDREASCYLDAVMSAHADLISAGVRIVRFEPDYLVSQAEIARRACLSRAAITNYVNGDRGAGFPAPVARIMSQSPLWNWATVASWLHDHGQLSADLVAIAQTEFAVNQILSDDQFHGATQELRDRVTALTGGTAVHAEPRVSVVA
jgi:hypothetical protein